jgi:hypothetical protein
MIQLEEKEWSKIKGLLNHLYKTKEKRDNLIHELKIGQKGLECTEPCPQCDDDVGFTCPSCYSANIMRETYRYLETIGELV